MLKMKLFDTSNPNFLSKDANTWRLEGEKEKRKFNALWIDRSDDHSMFLSFTQSFMKSENEGEKSLFDEYYENNATEIDRDFNVVFKNNQDEKKGNPPILNLTDSNNVDIMAFRVLVKDNEMITNINTGFGVNNYSGWISPDKQELILVSSFDDDDSCLQIFVQDMDTDMVTKYLISFKSCFASIPFPSSKKFKVPEKIRIPITRHDLSRVAETLVIVMDQDELSSFEEKVIGEKSVTAITISDEASPDEILKDIQDLSNNYREYKVILVRTSPIITGMIIKTFHNNVYTLHQYNETGKLFKIV